MGCSLDSEHSMMSPGTLGRAGRLIVNYKADYRPTYILHQHVSNKQCTSASAQASLLARRLARVPAPAAAISASGPSANASKHSTALVLHSFGACSGNVLMLRPTASSRVASAWEAVERAALRKSFAVADSDEAAGAWRRSEAAAARLDSAVVCWREEERACSR